MMSKYMQVVWLYLIGLLIIFVGIFTLVSSPGPTSFIIMLVGLAVAALGAAHGRRMRMMGQLDIDQIMHEKGLMEEKPEKPKPEDFPQQEGAGEAPEGQGQAAAVTMSTRLRELMMSFKRRPPEEPLSQEEIMQLEMSDIKEGKIVPTEADIIEFVCPMCGAANEERNYFCFKCGNRLRRKTPREDETGRTHLKVEPGSIELVENQRVAKVVICPKCNVPNKVGDKFCWRCGKKIKSESKEVKKIAIEEPVLPKKGKSRSPRKRKKAI
jgi:ribosomal protein L40E